MSSFPHSYYYPLFPFCSISYPYSSHFFTLIILIFFLRARLLPIAEFAYNNAKNASTGHTPFELNYVYHPRVSYEEDIDPRSRSKSTEELGAELKDLMAICKETLQHVQEWQTKAHNQVTKPRSYAPGHKVWLISKYIKTKRNRKLEAMVFGPFRVLQPVGKQAYKLEIPKRWRIHDVFHVSLQEQDTTRKGRVDEKIAEQLEFEAGNDEEYEVEGTLDSAVYAKESEAGHLPCLYYLVSWKGYPEDESKYVGTGGSDQTPSEDRQSLP